MLYISVEMCEYSVSTSGMMITKQTGRPSLRVQRPAPAVLTRTEATQPALRYNQESRCNHTWPLCSQQYYHTYRAESPRCINITVEVLFKLFITENN